MLTRSWCSMLNCNWWRRQYQTELFHHNSANVYWEEAKASTRSRSQTRVPDRVNALSAKHYSNMKPSEVYDRTQSLWQTADFWVSSLTLGLIADYCHAQLTIVMHRWPLWQTAMDECLPGDVTRIPSTGEHSSTAIICLFHHMEAR